MTYARLKKLISRGQDRKKHTYLMRREVSPIRH